MNIRIKIKIRNKTNAAIFALAAFSMSAFFFTVFQTLSINDMRYERSEKTALMKDANLEKEKLEIRLAKLKNSQNLKASASGLDMVEVAKVNYVSVEGGSNVAFKR